MFLCEALLLHIPEVQSAGRGITPAITNTPTPITAKTPPNKAVAKQHGVQKQLAKQRIH